MSVFDPPFQFPLPGSVLLNLELQLVDVILELRYPPLAYCGSHGALSFGLEQAIGLRKSIGLEQGVSQELTKSFVAASSSWSLFLFYRLSATSVLMRPAMSLFLTSSFFVFVFCAL